MRIFWIHFAQRNGTGQLPLWPFIDGQVIVYLREIQDPASGRAREIRHVHTHGENLFAGENFFRREAGIDLTQNNGLFMRGIRPRWNFRHRLQNYSTGMISCSSSSRVAGMSVAAANAYTTRS